MLNKSKLAAVGLLAAVFLAGGLAGWGGREAAGRDTDGRRGSRVGGRRGPERMVAYLSRELNLSDAQRDSVRAIFARHQPETDSLWARVRPRFDSIKVRMRAEINAVLTPEQRARHQQLIDQAEHHRKGRGEERGGEGRH